jgi:hypothetical protein
MECTKLLFIWRSIFDRLSKSQKWSNMTNCSQKLVKGQHLPSFLAIPRRNLGAILGMGEIPFIPKVVEARPNSSMCRLCVCVGISTVSSALCTLCTSYIVLTHVDVHTLLWMNVCRFLEPLLHSFMVVFPN